MAHVAREVSSALQRYEMQEDVFILAALEILAVVGRHPAVGLSQTIHTCSQLHLAESRTVKLKAFSTLKRMGYAGYCALIELASRDYTPLQPFLLEQLARSKAI